MFLQCSIILLPLYPPVSNSDRLWEPIFHRTSVLTFGPVTWRAGRKKRGRLSYTIIQILVYIPIDTINTKVVVRRRASAHELGKLGEMIISSPSVFKARWTNDYAQRLEAFMRLPAFGSFWVRGFRRYRNLQSLQRYERV